MDGNVPGAQSIYGIRADATGVVITVTEQYHGADRQVRCLRAQLLEAVAQARRGSIWLQRFEILYTSGHVVNAVKARLERAVEARENAVVERLYGLTLAGGAVLGYGHASRVVHEHGDDVLLRLQLRDRDRRLPEQGQHDCGDCRLQTPHIQARQMRIAGAARFKRERISQASPAAAARISNARTHFGHAAKNANWPRS